MCTKVRGWGWGECQEVVGGEVKGEKKANQGIRAGRIEDMATGEKILE